MLEHETGHRAKWAVVKGSPDPFLKSSIVPLSLRHMVTSRGVVHHDVQLVEYLVHEMLEFLVTMHGSDGEPGLVV